jgi:hypothetical protein
MKRILLAVAFFGTASVASATVPSATPVWGCHLEAKVVESNGFYFVAKIENLKATGTIVCLSATGKSLGKMDVDVTVHGLGAGIGFGRPADYSQKSISAFRAGIATPQGMIGNYKLSAGAGLGLFVGRIGVDAALGASRNYGAETGVDFTFDEGLTIGLDVTGRYVTVKPATKPVVKSKG